LGNAIPAPPEREVDMSPDWELVMRLLMAAALGSVIGADRERLVWAAGLRTHMLVSVGACLFMIVSAYGFSDRLGDHVILDPSRVAAQVVSGIGFLGAGSILLRGEVVRGLTTAASLWTVRRRWACGRWRTLCRGGRGHLHHSGHSGGHKAA